MFESTHLTVLLKRPFSGITFRLQLPDLIRKRHDSSSRSIAGNRPTPGRGDRDSQSEARAVPHGYLAASNGLSSLSLFSAGGGSQRCFEDVL